MHLPVSMQLTGRLSGMQKEHQQAWAEAFLCFDAFGSMAEAKLAARTFWRCPDMSVREQLLASLSRAQPMEALTCGIKMAKLDPLSPSCFESLLQALANTGQDGELLVDVSCLVW